MSDDALTILTAYHEAGHAVIALQQGRSVREVSILPGGKRLGTILTQLADAARAHLAAEHPPAQGR